MSVVHQVLGSEVGWKCDRDRQPGEKVLQDIKERREQERRLREIQQQLELLGLSQEMTVSLKSHGKKTYAYIQIKTYI